MEYEKAIIRLQEIVTKLDKGEASLDETVTLFKEGTELSKLCYDKLNKAEQEIQKLAKDVEV